MRREQYMPLLYPFERISARPGILFGKAVSFLFGFLFCMYTVLPAQNAGEPLATASARAQGSARVIEANVTLLTLREMRIDKVQPSEGIITLNPVTNSNAGLMKADGAPNAEVQVTFQQQVTLVHESGTNTLTFRYEIAGNRQDNQAASELVTNSSRNFQLNEEGEFFIWVGGRVDITNAISGNYEGEFTVEVEYI